MSVSYYQIMYSESNGHFEKASDSKSTPIYKLNSLAQGDYFKKFVKVKYGYELYNFASDGNLIEEAELPPLSTEYLKPEGILEDLKIYKKLLEDIESEMENPKDELLAKEISWWSLNNDRIQYIETEIVELEKICHYAKEKGYFMKYACDY